MFDIDSNNNIIIKEPIILLIKEYKTLWDKDKSKNKSQVLKDFAYIYFKNDLKSPYRRRFSEEELEIEVIRDLELGDKWKPSKEIMNAEEKYKELQQTKSLKVLQAAEKAMDQIIEYFNNFKLSSIKEEDKADVVTKLMKNIQGVDDTVGKLEMAREKVARELEDKKLSGKKVLSSRELPKSKRK